MIVGQYKTALDSKTQQELYEKWKETNNDHYRIKLTISYVSLVAKITSDLKLDQQKDVISEIVNKIYNAMPKYDPSRASIYTYLYRLIHTKLIDIYRKQKRYNDHYTSMEDEHLDYLNNLEYEDAKTMELKEEQDILTNAINGLPEINRKLIICVYYEKMSITKTMQILKITRTRYDNLLNESLEILKEDELIWEIK